MDYISAASVLGLHPERKPVTILATTPDLLQPPEDWWLDEVLQPAPWGPALPAKPLLLGVALTGAKFTPNNHANGGDSWLDEILRGDHVPVSFAALGHEVRELHNRGVRYYHWHPRNPQTREQSCATDLFRRFGRNMRRCFPGTIISYGASRNGAEIQGAMAAEGEWARVQQAALPLKEGGAEFITTVAAAELILEIDLEKQGVLRLKADGEVELLKPLSEFVPSPVSETVAVAAHSTSGGASYGSSSPAVQLKTTARAIAARHRLNLPQEVEWTQLERSYTLTKILLDHLRPGLGSTGRLNITILFGFSPKLPFPLSYDAFCRAVSLARSLERGAVFPDLHLTICVGAAILPQHATKLIHPLDVGPYAGVVVEPLERLIAYACQPDSGVDMFRFGLEDHPFLLDKHGDYVPINNLDLAKYVVERIERHGGRIVTDPIAVRHFAATHRPL